LTNTNIFNSNLSNINPGTSLQNNFTVKQNLQLLKNRNNRGIARIRISDCLGRDIDVIDASTEITYSPVYNRIYDHVRNFSVSVFIPDNSGNSNLSKLTATGRMFYIPSGPGESFYVDHTVTTVTLPAPVPGNLQTAQYYHDVAGGRIIETSTGNTIRSILVNNRVFLVFGASMLGISMIDVYRAQGFPAIYDVYSYYGTRNLALPEKVSQVYTVIGNTNVSLNWEPSFSDGKPRLGYIIEYAEQEPVAQLYIPWTVFSDNYPLTNVTITGLTNGKKYYFKVAAKNIIGRGPYSDVVTATPGRHPDPISTLFTTSLVTNSGTIEPKFILEWSYPYDQGYEIQKYTIRYRKVSSPAENPPPINLVWPENDHVLNIGLTDPLLVRNTIGNKTVISYTINEPGYILPSPPPPETQNLYHFQISSSNILGTSEISNPAPITNTLLLDPDSMTVVLPSVVFSRIGPPPSKVQVSTIFPTIIPDNGGKKVKLSWIVPTPYTYVPYAYSIKYAILTTDPSGVVFPIPENVPDASWNIVSQSSFTVSNDAIRTASESGATSAVMTTISNLTNGLRYSFKVAGLNAAGRGEYSNAVPVSIIPGSVPSVLNVNGEIAFTINTTTGGNITVYWIIPNKNGYSITTYRIRRRIYLQGDSDWITTEITVPQNITNTQPYRTMTYNGLVNGTTYEFQVASRNQLGWSEYSSSLYAVPRTIPTPVSLVTIGVLNESLQVNWNTTGTNDGGYPITGYRVQYLPVTVSTPVDAWQTIEVEGIYNSKLILSNLKNGITHRIRVLQVNAIGQSSLETSPIVEGVPGIVSLAPTKLLALPGNTVITLYWTPPTSSGTNDINYYYIQYKKTSDPIQSYAYVKNTGQTTPKEFTLLNNFSTAPNAPGYDAFFGNVEGLTNGVSYDVRVAAVTQVGIGQWSDPVSEIPGTVPSKVV
jgi:hypothetical protein